jgi:hypothetical protein
MKSSAFPHLFIACGRYQKSQDINEGVVVFRNFHTESAGTLEVDGNIYSLYIDRTHSLS